MKIGEIVFKKFEVLSPIGSSAMSTVAKARHIFLDRAFVLKVLNPETFNDRSLIRFQNEARILSKLSHPNIATVYDFGLSEDSVPYLAIEFVEGETLSDLLERSGPLSLEEVIPLILQLCDALAHAHDAGIIHRDIKPSNIMIRRIDGDMHAVLLDFGVAKLVAKDDDQGLTHTGDLVGTPAYMSPEQCQGREIDETTDQYALGCVIFAMLTGNPPFCGESALETMLLHQNEESPELSQACARSIPTELDQIVDTLLAKKSEDRYETISLLADALSALKPERVNAEDNENLVSDQESSGKAVSTKTLIMLAGALLLFLSAAIFLVQTALDADKLKITTKSSSDLDSSSALSSATMFGESVKRGALKFRADFGASDDELLDFKDYKNAQFLKLGGTSVTNDGLAYLKDSKLLSLNLASCNQVTSVRNVATQVYLQDLSLSDTGIGDTDLAELARLRMLSKLNLDGCNISEAGITKLIPSTSLTVVQLTNGKYSKQFIEKLKKKMPQCSFPGYSKYSVLDFALMQSKIPDEYSKYTCVCSIAEKANPLCSAVSAYLCTRAVLLLKQGRIAEAHKLMEQDLEVNEKSGNLILLALSLQREGETHARNGNMKDAIAFIDRAYIYFQDTMFKDDPHLPEVILSLTNCPQQAHDIKRVVSYCDTAIDLVHRYPNPRGKTLLPLLYDKAGRMYYEHADPKSALPYFRKNVDLFRLNEQTNSPLYAAALINLGHCLPSGKARIAAYKEGLALLDSFGLPEEHNLKDHYCDALFSMAQIYDQESHPARAADCMKRALSVVKGMKHFDKYKDTAYSSALADYLKRSSTK